MKADELKYKSNPGKGNQFGKFEANNLIYWPPHGLSDLSETEFKPIEALQRLAVRPAAEKFFIYLVT
jgi:hypothetical protein